MNQLCKKRVKTIFMLMDLKNVEVDLENFVKRLETIHQKLSWAAEHFYDNSGDDESG